MFKDSTLSLIEHLIKIISHETERLILLVMPYQEDTAIFKLLVHYRRRYLSDRHSAEEGNKPDPCTAAHSFAYLRKHCTGNNERTIVLYKYPLINHEHKNTQTFSIGPGLS